MTRPMPGPPECECREVPEQFWTTHYGAVDPVTRFEYNPECPLHGEVSSSKHLSDAECAAEYWRARADSWAYELMHLSNWFGWPDDAEVVADPSPDDVSRWDDITHRFATRPHAVKETHDDLP